MDLTRIKNMLLTPLVWIRLVRRPMVSFFFKGRTMASVRKTPSTDIFNLVKCGERPRCRTISFMAWVIGAAEVVKSSMRRFPLFPPDW